MIKRTAALLLAAVILMGMLLAGCGKDDGGEVYAESVGVITGMGYSGLNNRFSGVIVSGSTQTINKDKDKKILELYVSAGDSVKAGDKLFSYDVQAVELALKKLELEREQLENSLAVLEKEIEKYEKKVASASASRKLELEVQLQTYQIEEKEKRIELDSKNEEYERTGDMLSNSDVVSKVTGVVQTVNKETAGETDENGKIIPYMTIIETGAYRVKGSVSELDVNNLREGSRVVLRSRVDDTTWSGKVEYIEWDNPEKQQGDFYVEEEGESNRASKYPFYVALDDTDGLMLGQHVYIEPVSGDAGGMMLPEYYINDAEGSAWVWAANKRSKLEKRDVELGEYDADLCCYEIIKGLTAADFIAFPDESYREGMNVICGDMATEEGGYEEMGGYEDFEAEIGTETDFASDTVTFGTEAAQ